MWSFNSNEPIYELQKGCWHIVIQAIKVWIVSFYWKSQLADATEISYYHLKIPCAKSGIAFHVRTRALSSAWKRERAFERASRVETRAEELCWMDNGPGADLAAGGWVCMRHSARGCGAARASVSATPRRCEHRPAPIRQPQAPDACSPTRCCSPLCSSHCSRPQVRPAYARSPFRTPN